MPSLKTRHSLEEEYFNLNDKETIRSQSKGQRLKTVHKYLETGERERPFPLCHLYNKSLAEVQNPEIRLATKMSGSEGKGKKVILEKIKIKV